MFISVWHMFRDSDEFDIGNREFSSETFYSVEFKTAKSVNFCFLSNFFDRSKNKVTSWFRVSLFSSLSRPLRSCESCSFSLEIDFKIICRLGTFVDLKVSQMKV